MSKCPYCDYETPTPDEGDATARAWQEIAHMQLNHPDVLTERMRAIGVFDASSRFEQPRVVTGEMRDVALRFYHERKANPPVKVENDKLPAGSPIHVYCRHCGWPSDLMPETYFLGVPRRVCTECEAMVKLGLMPDEATADEIVDELRKHGR